ncbi:MAG TPA: M1 family metallopeptidase [Kofleriaceae bacterium]|nr:M1 family metallopeptidase [Kofleriaceae bacterium]
MRIGLALLAACAASPPPPPHGVEPPPAPAAAAPDPSDAEPAAFHVAGPFRLPHTFEPSGYRVSLALGEREFTGHVEIDGTVSEAVKLLWLHGVDLVVTRAVVRRATREIPLVASHPRRDQLLGFIADEPIEPGPWTIAIDYAGPVRQLAPPRDGMDAWAEGLFRRVEAGSSYFFTQGEAITARMIFPCIDEPDRKVPWQLALDIPSADLAASNTPIVRETPLADDRKLVEFAPTSPLPSYLVAFAVGPFEVVNAARSRRGVPIRIFEIAGSGANAMAARAAAPGILDELEAWLGEPFPYAKLDLIAVPHTGWSAMENPGLVTFDRLALENPHPDYVIAHELAHQWFGDLVTPRWWDDIWLNESFADWLARRLEDSTGPDRHVTLEWLENLHARVRPRIGDDAALEQDMFVPPESIERGAAVLDLLDAGLGDARFREVLRRYLHAHAHGNVTTADLAAAVDAVTGTSSDALLDALLDHTLPQLDTTIACGGKPRVHFEIDVDAPVCFAYEARGKRVDTCTTVQAPATDIALPACPAWLLPGANGFAPYYLQLDTLVGPLLAHWSAMTPVEHRALFAELDEPAMKLRVFRKLDDARELSAVAEARYLDSIVPLVPDELRPRFDAWVRTRFQVHYVRDPLAELVSSIGDRDLAREAVPFARALLAGAHYPAMQEIAILRFAADADPKIASAELAQAIAHRDFLMLSALSGSRSLPDLVRDEPDQIAQLGPTAMALFQRACDPQLRQQAAALDDHRPVELIDRCLVTKAALAPAFRAWLK